MSPDVVDLLEEAEQSEIEMKFFYFLVSIGIKSALEPARDAFKRHMNALALMTVGG